MSNKIWFYKHRCDPHPGQLYVSDMTLIVHQHRYQSWLGGNGRSLPRWFPIGEARHGILFSALAPSGSSAGASASHFSVRSELSAIKIEPRAQCHLTSVILWWHLRKLCWPPMRLLQCWIQAVFYLPANCLFLATPRYSCLQHNLQHSTSSLWVDEQTEQVMMAMSHFESFA